MKTVHERFDQPMLDLLADCGVISRDQQNEILEIQAGLLAVHQARNNLPFFARSGNTTSPEHEREGRDLLSRLTAEIQWHGIDERQLREARKTVVSKHGMPEAVPPVGIIAVELGLLNSQTVLAYLLAQTGAALLRVSDRFTQRNFYADPCSMDLSLIIDENDSDKIARSHIGSYDEAPVLITAQAALHLVELADCVVGTHPSLASDLRFDDLKRTASLLAREVLRKAADILAEQGRLIDAREIHHALPEHTSRLTYNRIEDLYDFVLYSIGPLKNHGLLEVSRAKRLGELIDLRMSQIEIGTLLDQHAPKVESTGPDAKASLHMHRNDIAEPA